MEDVTIKEFEDLQNQTLSFHKKFNRILNHLISSACIYNYTFNSTINGKFKIGDFLIKITEPYNFQSILIKHKKHRIVLRARFTTDKGVRCDTILNSEFYATKNFFLYRELSDVFKKELDVGEIHLQGII